MRSCWLGTRVVWVFLMGAHPGYPGLHGPSLAARPSPRPSGNPPFSPGPRRACMAWPASEGPQSRGDPDDMDADLLVPVGALALRVLVTIQRATHYERVHVRCSRVRCSR